MLCAVCAQHDAPQRPARLPARPAHTPSSPVAPKDVSAERRHPHVRYIAIGGGATPESTEVSLEQDLALSARSLPGPGDVLFAGGSDASCVRTLDPTIDESSLLVRLGDFFEPRSGRTSRYRKPTLEAEAATLPNVERALSDALSDGTDPLLLYVAAHGEQGENARDNHVVLWGGETLTVKRVAELQGKRTRPLRMLIASCFSGGFAELAFESATVHDGLTSAPRCGLFAGTWDRETSGCDPNPDRRAQESYSLHVLHALRGEDRDGKRLDPKDVDFDGDGVISLFEAHTRARIASTSIDVPTTTSERYLREVQHHGGAIDASVLPEDAAVVAQLGARLGLLTLPAVKLRWKALDEQLAALDTQLDAAEAQLERARSELSARLLGHWPVLDDAYHPDFASTLAHDGPAITRTLDSGDLAKSYRAALAEVNELDERYSDLQTSEAVVTRLLRAYETLQLASALAKRGGAAYQGYRKLLACERTPP